MTSWSRGEFVTLPPPTAQLVAVNGGDATERSRSVKRKRRRAPSTPTTSDEEVSILEGGPIAFRVRSPPRKRLTRGVFPLMSYYLSLTFGDLLRSSYQQVSKLV